VSRSDSLKYIGPTSAFYQGMEAERERIIRLLKEHWIFRDVESYENYLFVIALIKGEEK
jgi:hypothetical protein